MTTPQQLQDGLTTLFAALLGIPCQWAKRPRKFQGTAQSWIDMLGQPTGIGVDERSTVMVDDAGDVTTDPDVAVGIQETVDGQREFTLQVTVWSNRQTLGERAGSYLELLRTRLRFSSSVETLAGLGLATITLAPTRDVAAVDQAADGREFSQAILEIRFGYGVSQTDVVAPFIQTMRAKSDTLNRADGTPEPDALQIDQTGPG